VHLPTSYCIFSAVIPAKAGIPSCTSRARVSSCGGVAPNGDEVGVIKRSLLFYTDPHPPAIPPAPSVHHPQNLKNFVGIGGELGPQRKQRDTGFRRYDFTSESRSLFQQVRNTYHTEHLHIYIRNHHKHIFWLSHLHIFYLLHNRFRKGIQFLFPKDIRLSWL